VALTTLGGLKTALAAWSTYADVTDQLDDFVAWAHQEINRRLRANVMLATADLTIIAETVSQPTGFLSFKRLYLDVTPRQRVKVTTPEEVSDIIVGSCTAQYPTHVAVEGSLLHFAPIFTGSPTGKALYYAEPDALVDDADTNVVMVRYPYLYLYGAMEALHVFKEDDDQVQVWGGRFSALIEDINTRDAADRAGSAPARRVKSF
jgi:hypothetical protein